MVTYKLLALYLKNPYKTSAIQQEVYIEIRELKIQCMLNSNIKEIADKIAVRSRHLKWHKNMYT